MKLTVLIALVFLSASFLTSEACHTTCLSTADQCGISPKCQDICLPPNSSLLQCIRDNPEVCPPENSPQVQCLLSISFATHCGCSSVTSCQSSSDKELSNGGLCKLNEFGIIVIAISCFVFLILVGAGVWAYRHRDFLRREIYDEIPSDNEGL